MEALLKGLGALLLLILLMVYGTFMSGLVVYEYWKWFGHVVFPTLNYPISFVQAIALSYLLMLFKNIKTDEMKDEFKDTTKKYGGYLVPWIMLGLGWLVHLFIY